MGAPASRRQRVKACLCHPQLSADNPCSLRDKGAGGKNRFQLPYTEGLMPNLAHEQAKTVFVRNYTRIRFGNLEHVCSHWRSAPGQLSFNFD